MINNDDKILIIEHSLIRNSDGYATTAYHWVTKHSWGLKREPVIDVYKEILKIDGFRNAQHKELTKKSITWFYIISDEFEIKHKVDEPTRLVKQLNKSLEEINKMFEFSRIVHFEYNSMDDFFKKIGYITPYQRKKLRKDKSK